MDKLNYIILDCIKVVQPIGEFYIGAIKSKNLSHISYVDVRRIENEERDVERYLGIQRPLSKGRIKELKEYVQNIDATFPTSIVIAIPSDKAEYNENDKTIKIQYAEDVAKIIDGQHRIAGLEDYVDDNFQLIVTIFVEMDIEDQAMVFATINLEQTKVPKSLAYDLYEYTKSRSPQKTCHNITKLLNIKEQSPFKDKIKILGVATGKPQESITQSTFVERLMNLISNEPDKDRRLLKGGKKPKRATGSDIKKLIFRNMFLDEEDAEIAKNIWNYFKAVEKKWPDAWPKVKSGNILNRTTGFGALMRFLRDVYNSFDQMIVTIEQYYSIFERINLRDNDFTPEVYKPGSSGEVQLHKKFLELADMALS